VFPCTAVLKINPNRQIKSEKRKTIFISPAGVGVWLRHDLQTFKKRLKAKKVAEYLENV